MWAVMATSSLRSPFTLLANSSTAAGGLSDAFSQLRKQGKLALISYIMAVDPDLSTTAETLKVVDNCKADIIELGVLYSDQLAVGPIIQPTAVGFGISRPEQVRLVSEWGVDGVIVGSDMVKLLGESECSKEDLKNLAAFTKSLKSALEILSTRSIKCEI